MVDFWSIPESIKWDNYTQAFDAVRKSIGNSIYVAVMTISLALFTGSLTGYVFARHNFPAKNILYLILIGCMMVPSLLLIVPLYSVIVKFGLTNNYWGLILPYASGQQLFALLIIRSFIERIPEELFEAARLDGGSEFYLYRRIAIPLCIPVLITITVVSFVGVYNDYLLPLIVLDESKYTFSVAAVNLTSAGRQDIGLTFGAYVLGSIPMIILLTFGMKHYVQGLTSSAVKA